MLPIENQNIFIQVCEESFKANAIFCGYEVARDKNPHWVDTNLHPLQYRKNLPRFNGRDVEDHIQMLIERGHIVRVLDIGCGEGWFLLRQRQRWGTRVEAYGLTAFPYHLPRDEDQVLKREDLEKLTAELRIYQVDIKLGDAQSIHNVFPSDRYKFDLVVAAFVAEHLADPCAMLMGMYASLKVGGVGLVCSFPVRLEGHRQRISLIEYLESDYSFVLTDIGNRPLDRQNPPDWINIAFQKQQLELLLPLEYSSILDQGKKGKVIAYRLKED